MLTIGLLLGMSLLSGISANAQRVDFVGPASVVEVEKAFVCKSLIRAARDVSNLEGPRPAITLPFSRKGKRCGKKFVKNFTNEVHILNFLVGNFNSDREAVIEWVNRNGATETLLWISARPQDLTVPVLPNCDKVLNSRDGSGGFLWKPSSDSGGLVVLFPGRFQTPFESVKVVTNGKVKEKLRFTGFANADAEGERQHYRSDRSGGSFLDGSFVVADDQGELLCYEIEETNSRVD